MDRKDTKLKQVRKAKGLTQKELAEATGMSMRTLQHLEQGARDLNGAAAMTVYTIAKALGVEMTELLDIPEPEETHNKKMEERKSMEKILGYDEVDGGLVVNADEAEIVKFLYEKIEEYSANPPEVLVDAVIEKARENDEVITYEEAKQLVPFSAILEYINEEMNNNAEFREVIKKIHPHTLKGTLRTAEGHELIGDQIVAKELWDRAQAKLKNQ